MDGTENRMIKKEIMLTQAANGSFKVDQTAACLFRSPSLKIYIFFNTIFNTIHYELYKHTACEFFLQIQISASVRERK